MTNANSILSQSKALAISDQFRAGAGSGFSNYLRAAQEYLMFYNWCDSILEEYVGAFFDGIVGVFLFKISKTRSDVDDWIWVIVGDLPPTYLTRDICPDVTGALDGYIGAMMEWVEAAENGESVAGLIPVNVPATPINASLLRKRLQFLEDRILPKLQRGEQW